MAGNGASHGPEKVVIAGGGIIGCATAYYLSKLGVAATVLEKGEVACASSGKAGKPSSISMPLWLSTTCLSGGVFVLANESHELHAIGLIKRMQSASAS